jgi:hypothetical protein
MPVVTLTPSFMASGLVVQPGDKRTEYCDTEVRGLLIECRSAVNAVPTWYLRYKANGKTAYTRLVNVQELSLAQARRQAIMLKAQHTVAPKQSVEAKAPIGSMTLDVFMRDHYFPHAEMHKRSWKRDDQLYRIRIKPRFGNTPLNELSRHQFQAFHIALVKEEGLSPASADRHLALARHALALAVDWSMLEKNVLTGFKLFLVDNRVDNYLNDEQVQRFKEVLLSDDNRPVCLILLFLLVVGTRLGSALHARWKDIDMDNAVWLVVKFQ